MFAERRLVSIVKSFGGRIFHKDRNHQLYLIYFLRNRNPVNFSKSFVASPMPVKRMLWFHAAFTLSLFPFRGHRVELLIARIKLHFNLLFEWIIGNIQCVTTAVMFLYN